MEVEIIKTNKEFKTDNFIATISKIPLENYIGNLRDKKNFIKLK